MKNKKFLFGLTLGLIGKQVYSKYINPNLKPLGIKAMSAMLSIENEKNKFLQEVSEEVKNKRKEEYTNSSEKSDISSKLYESELDEINKLSKQIAEMQNRLKKVTLK